MKMFFIIEIKNSKDKGLKTNVLRTCVCSGLYMHRSPNGIKFLMGNENKVLKKLIKLLPWQMVEGNYFVNK